MSYSGFLASKAFSAPATGFEAADLGDHLAPFQELTTRWALRRGRAAVFADTGLGKTRMQLTWAHQVNRHLVASGAPRSNVLILAPLAVAAQTVKEGVSIGVDVTYCRSQEAVRDGITITNYDMLDRFDPSAFGAVVIDESSIIKNFTGATRNQIIESFRGTQFKLACTATPSPNDFTELGNHAEFLGVMSRAEMLASFFVHDGGSTQDWRIKGHAKEAFWKWVCSWGAMVKFPSDLGDSDDGYILPPLKMIPHIIPSTQEQARASGLLFAEPARTLSDQRVARRATLSDRARVAAACVAAEPKEPWILWCELNDESAELARSIPGAVELCGADKPEVKESVLAEFASGAIRVLVTKPSIAGFGMNWQHCAREIFVGASHSHEQTYQAIRRCWRFGQKRPVNVHVVTSELEGAVVENLLRKERDAAEMSEQMRKHTSSFVRESVGGVRRETTAYEPRKAMNLPSWLEST